MQGLLLIDKPENKTSFSVVRTVKRIASEKRTGHTGTLDPMATGVLPVLLGRATALAGIMLDTDKRYTAEIKLGITTDTEDITGTVLTEKEVCVTQQQLEDALKHFTGEIIQRPPMYSAIKKDGVRLYKLAREGKTVEIKERNITIFSCNLISPLINNTFKIDVHVSKGTYIRSLARDIGEYLGCGATLTSLIRTYAGGFNIEDCVKLENLTADNVDNYIKSEELAVSHLRYVNVTEKQAIRFCNGGQLDFLRLNLKDIKENELLRVKFNDLFIGVGLADFEKNELAIKCIINYPKGCER